MRERLTCPEGSTLRRRPFLARTCSLMARACTSLSPQVPKDVFLDAVAPYVFLSRPALGASVLLTSLHSSASSTHLRHCRARRCALVASTALWLQLYCALAPTVTSSALEPPPPLGALSTALSLATTIMH